MEEIPTYSDNLFNVNLKVLSYHRFVDEPAENMWSRTYDQFENDLNTKDFDWITIDDGEMGQIRACEMMEGRNIRAKLFITTASVGVEEFCNWDDIWALSRLHDIGNHSHFHKRLIWLSDDEVHENIGMANEEIKKYTGIVPRYFVPPYNKWDKRIETIAGLHGLTLVHNRIDILNITP